jgi:hypothetical protein
VHTFALDRAVRIRRLLAVWNLVWSPVSSLAVVGAAIVGLFGLFLFASGTLEIVTGFRLMAHRAEEGTGIVPGAILIGLALLAFLTTIYIPLLNRRLIAALMVLATSLFAIGISLPAFALISYLPSWWSAISEIPRRLDVETLSILNPSRVETSPGLAVWSCLALVLAALILGFQEGREEPPGHRYVEVVVLSVWVGWGAWVALVLPLLESQALPVVLAVGAAGCLLYYNDHWYDRIAQAAGVAGIVLAGAALIFLTRSAAASLGDASFSLAPIVNPALANRSPFIATLALLAALALVWCGLGLRERAFEPLFRLLGWVPIALGGTWLAAALLAQGFSGLQRISAAGARVAEQLVVAVGQSAKAGTLDAIAQLFRLGGELLAQIHSAYIFLAAILWPAAVAVAIAFNLAAGGFAARVFYYVVSDRSSLAAAQQPIPRRFRSRIKYAMGLAPISYLSRVQSRWAVATSLIGKIARSLCALLLVYLFLSLNGSNVRFVVSSASPEGPSLSEIYGGTDYVTVGFVAVGLLVASLATRWLTFRFDTARYEEIRLKDGRRPLLFLRPFQNDKAVFDFDSRLLAADGAANLDQLLVHLGGAYGPVIAAGRPGETLPPFGAARTYVRDGDWHDKIASLIEESRLVIAVVSDTEGIGWEIDYIIRTKHERKTLFILDRALSWEARSAFLEKLGFGTRGLEIDRIIAVVLARDRKIALTASSADHDAHYCAVMMGLLLMLGYPEGVSPRPKRLDHSLSFISKV